MGSWEFSSEHPLFWQPKYRSQLQCEGHINPILKKLLQNSLCQPLFRLGASSEGGQQPSRRKELWTFTHTHLQGQGTTFSLACSKSLLLT